MGSSFIVLLSLFGQELAVHPRFLHIPLWWRSTIITTSFSQTLSSHARSAQISTYENGTKRLSSLPWLRYKMSVYIKVREKCNSIVLSPPQVFSCTKIAMFANWLSQKACTVRPMYRITLKRKRTGPNWMKNRWHFHIPLWRAAQMIRCNEQNDISKTSVVS